MNLFGVLQISGSALTAERQRAEVSASNLANAQTTETPQGGPYRRKEVVFRTVPVGSFADTLSTSIDGQARGVRVERVVQDQTPPDRRYEPGNPHADAQGYVSYPAVNPIEEMVNLMGAARSYELNVSAIQSTKALIQQSLQILS